MSRIPQTTLLTSLSKELSTPSQFGWKSLNWSGYAMTSGTKKFNSVSAEWIVPVVHPTSSPTYSSTWIGIDGFRNKHLIQAGTEQDYVHGNAQYYAWWEILPDVERRISSVAVKPGDLMYVEIRNLGNGDWRICLCNLTSGKRFTTIQVYRGPQTSVEWIQEAPLIDDKIASLAKFREFDFRHCCVNGMRANLSDIHRGALIQQKKIVSVPSAPNENGDGFSIRHAEQLR